MTMEQDKPILLGVNIDHIAQIRQHRGTRYPDPVHAAFIAEQAGADAITVHLREDRRHIQERDVEILRDVVATRLNLEMSVADDMVAIAERIKPHDVCLVPERREERTTEGGLDVVGNLGLVRSAVCRLTKAGCRVSLFIEADPKQIEAAFSADAPVVEIHTGFFADAPEKSVRRQEYDRIIAAVDRARQMGLQVNAGHGLHYHNVTDIAAIDGISELNIGHAIVARAVFTGFGEAVSEMKRLIAEARRR